MKIRGEKNPGLFRLKVCELRVTESETESWKEDDNFTEC